MQLRQYLFIGHLMVFFLLGFPGALPASNAHSEANAPDAPPAPVPLISQILVEISGFQQREAALKALAQDCIFLRKGDRFSPALVQESIQALKLSKWFWEVDVDSREEEEGIALLFRLEPFRLIKDITISGEFPLFEREIAKVMTVYVGDTYIREELPKQAGLIAELFRREGFAAPKVEVTAQEDPGDGNFALHVKINKGPHLTLAQLEIMGNQAFSDTTLKSKMKTWRASLLPGKSGRFVARELDEDIKNLITYYRTQGYADVVIDSKIKESSTSNGVSVLVTVSEGLRYEVEFIGNEAFPDATLTKDLAFYREGNRNDFGLRKSVRDIKKRYRMAGFLDTRLKVEDQMKAEGDKRIRMLRFVIDEGPCSIVNSIEIRGNQVFDEAKIKKQMLTRLPALGEKGMFVPETLGDDLNAIKSLYRKQGYMDTEVRHELTWSDDKRSVAITVTIEEKVQTLVSSVKITGTTVLSEEEAYKPLVLKEGEPLRNYMIKSDENAISALIAEKGYPHVTVKGEVSISEDRSRAQVIYHVTEGPYVEMGHVYYRGNFITKETILQRELEMAPGEPFSLTKMLRGQRNIRNLGIFSSVRFRAFGLKEKREKVDLLVDIEEKKPYFIQAGGGYETNRGFYLSARAGDHNLLGTNKDAWIAGELSQIGYRGELGITEPRLFGSRIATSFGLFSERKEEFNQDFGTKAVGSSLGFSREWLYHTTPSLNFRFEQREQYRLDTLEEAATVEDEDVFQPRSILVTTPTIRYDTRDSFIRPRKGIFSSLSVDISKGLRNSLDDFFKYRYDFRLYLSPLPRLTFAWLGRAGYIDPFGAAERVPDDQLFFLGGTSDVRGFNENLLSYDANGNPVGGRSALAGSMEARIDLGRNFELALFYDVGYVSDTYGESVPDKYRSSVGLGLRYITPIGPIGFLYGMKLDPEEGESSGRFHLSVGYTF
jgi:outer membrane protein insertion porin family